MTKSEMLERTSALMGVAINALMAAQSAQAVLKQANEEDWPEGDARWADKFADADAALKAAQDRL